MKELKNIKNILFDCDGVLYSDLEGVFGQVSKKMTQYISNKLNVDLKEAKELQTNYFHKYNTSLNGLMIHHDIPPREFLESRMKKFLLLISYFYLEHHPHSSSIKAFLILKILLWPLLQYLH